MIRPAISLLAVVALTGCVSDRPPTRADSTPIGPLAAAPAPSPETGTCYGRTTTPAIIETVTEQILVQPAVIRSDGSVETPAAFRTVTRQRILRERREVEFATPCATAMTPEFIASLQRALAVRGRYNGPITGTMDGRTQSAIQAFQQSTGDVDTVVLTLQTARALGLAVTPQTTL